jgi:hypothetical protein
MIVAISKRLGRTGVTPVPLGVSPSIFLKRALIVCLFLVLRPEVQACAVCFGKSDSRLAVGMNWGIFTLLFFIGSVLAGLSFFFVFLAMRASRHSQSVVKETPAELSQNPSHS